MSLENGWINSYSIALSSETKCGDMICDKCGKKIRGYYLVRDRSNFKHRGNETDERYLYHRKCRKNKIWYEFDKQRKENKKKEKIHEKNLTEIKDLIKKYNININDLIEE